MLKTSKATQPKSITTSRTKAKVITTSSTRKSRSETTSITNKKLFKPSTTTPFTLLRTPTSSSPSSLPTTTSSTLSSSFSPTTTSPTTTTSKSLLYPTLSLPPSSLPTSTSSSLSSSLSSLSSLSKFISLPFTTIFNLQSQQQPQQASQLESFIITPHLHQQFKNQFYSLTRSFQHKLLSQSNIFHSTKVQFKDESKPDYSNLDFDFEPLSIFDELGSLTPDGITFKYLNSNEFKAAMEEFELEARNNPIEALLTFTGAVAKHYPSEPLEFVTKFIRVNRTIFKRLFQHQVIKSIPSLTGDTTEQNEIVQIIFDEYHDLTTLILKLRGQGHSDEEIGSLLRKIYPEHFHSQINATLSKRIASPLPTCVPPETIIINGKKVLIHLQSDLNPLKPADLTKKIFDDLSPILSNHQQYLDAIQKTCANFVTALKHPKIQTFIAQHEDWYSNPNHSHKILQFLTQIYSPSFIPLDHPIDLTARYGEDNRDSTDKFYKRVDSAIESINQYRTSQFQFDPIMLPIKNTHLALSSQQVLLLMSARCLLKAKKRLEPTPCEKLSFQLLTGLTLENYLKQNPASTAWSLIVYGAQGIGKSLLLLLLFIASLFNVDWLDDAFTDEDGKANKVNDDFDDNAGKDNQQTNNVEQRTKVDILTCERADPRRSFQIQAHKDDDGQITDMYFLYTVNKTLYLNELVSHFYDAPDSGRPRDETDAQFNPSPRDSTTHTMISRGIEVRFLSAQEQNPHWWSPPRVRFQPRIDAVATAPSSPLAFPTYLIQSPSPFQTLLSLIKSTLYQHYLRTHSGLTPRHKIDFLKKLDQLTIDGLYDISLFDEWDNGTSLNITTNMVKPSATKRVPKAIKLQEEYPQSIMNLEYVSDLIHIVPLQEENRNKKSFVKQLIKQAFHITTKIDAYLQQFIYELRLLPYVSSSMRSASNFYALLHPTTTLEASRVARYDLFTRFFPVSFARLHLSQHDVTSASNKPKNSYSIGSVTKFSALAFFLQDLHKPTFESFISLTTKTPILVSTKQADDHLVLNFQRQIDEFATLYYATSLHNYFSKDPQTYFAQKYASNCTNHYYIDTTPHQLSLQTTVVNGTAESINIHTQRHGFPRTKSLYQQFEPTLNKTILLPISGSKQYTQVNDRIIQTIQFVYTALSTHHKQISVYLGTGGSPGYPAFDNALIYAHPASTTTEVKIGIHFVQVTVDKTRYRPSVYKASTELLAKIVEIEKKLNITICMNDWSILSPYPVHFYETKATSLGVPPDDQDENASDVDEDDQDENASDVDEDDQDENAPDVDEDDQDEKAPDVDEDDQDENARLPFLKKDPINVIVKTLQWPEMFNPFGNDSFKH